jgi:ADP-ribose pyrophosphatase
VLGAAFTIKTGLQDRLRVFVPEALLPRAEALLREIFPADFADEDGEPAEEQGHGKEECVLSYTDEQMREIRTGREEIFNGRVLHITRDTVRLSDGRESFREVAWHRGAVCVIPVTDDGEAVCVEQFRYAYGTVVLEIPAGKLDPGETDPAAAARRELQEETGYTAAELIPFGQFWGSVAILCEPIHVFLALGLTPGETDPDEGEFLRIRHIPLAELTEMVLRGEVPDGKTQCAALRAKLWLEENRPGFLR